MQNFGLKSSNKQVNYANEKYEVKNQLNYTNASPGVNIYKLNIFMHMARLKSSNKQVFHMTMLVSDLINLLRISLYITCVI